MVEVSHNLGWCLFEGGLGNRREGGIQGYLLEILEREESTF